MSKWLAWRIKRKYDALWVDLSFMTPFGSPTWAVRVKPVDGDDFQLARARHPIVALWKAWRA